MVKISVNNKLINQLRNLDIVEYNQLAGFIREFPYDRTKSWPLEVNITNVVLSWLIQLGIHPEIIINDI